MTPDYRKRRASPRRWRIAAWLAPLAILLTGCVATSTASKNVAESNVDSNSIPGQEFELVLISLGVREILHSKGINDALADFFESQGRWPLNAGELAATHNQNANSEQRLDTESLRLKPLPNGALLIGYLTMIDVVGPNSEDLKNIFRDNALPMPGQLFDRVHAKILKEHNESQTRYQ